MNTGDIIVATWGYNSVTKKPFSFLYEFGYYTEYGCVVYQQGCRNMQDSKAFKLDEVRLATEEDKGKFWWGK